MLQRRFPSAGGSYHHAVPPFQERRPPIEGRPAAFEVDALFLNDDRHLNNIAVLEKNDRFDYCPIFDNGAGLLSNVQMAPMDIEPAALIRSAKARPFTTTFNRQVIHARNLFDPQLHMPKFTEEALSRELEEPLSYYAQRDRGFIADRICQTILTRQRELDTRCG